jgi:hypothetical protein
MALTLPKLSLPDLALPNKRLLTIVGGVAVASAAGWFVWQNFADTGPAPAAPSRPQAVPATKAPVAAKSAAPVDSGPARDKLIADALVASGLKRQLDQLPQQLVAGVRQSGTPRSKTSAAVVKAIEDAVAGSFTAQGFHDRVSADLKKNFDQKRLQALLKEFSTPAARRMIELGQAAPSPEELARFARGAVATPPSSQRASLVKRIDAAIRASDLAVDVAFSSMRAVALGLAGDGAAKAAAVDKTIEKQRASATQAIRDATLLNLAFGFKDANDTELEEYAKICESENNKWFTGIVYASLLEEVKRASAQAGERIGSLASKPAAPAAKPVRSMRSKPGADARTCLDLAANNAIMICAEKYR